MAETERPIRAVVVDPDAAGRLVLREVEPPRPERSEALVRVRAISLNRGEVRRALTMAEAGWRPGWDLAGEVIRPAADGSGPSAGARVTGLLLASGAWSEVVAVPTEALGTLPDDVSFAVGATFPVAGLTALHAVEQGGGLLGRTVLVTGASGGVGHLAVQLAALSGADVVGLVRQESHATAVREAGARWVAIGEGAEPARAFGPYPLIVETVGGQTLGEAISLIGPDGVCVSLGSAAGYEARFQIGQFYGIGGARVYGFILAHELRREPASAGLARLGRLVSAGRLRPEVDVEAPWTEIADVARQLMERRFAGKAVLTL